MIVLLRRRYVMAAAVTLLAAAAAAALWAGPSARPAMAGTGRQTIVLDAGHGGEDGGAVSRDGVAESSVNLAITRKLRDVFLFLGRDTVLTREGEEAIYSPDCVTLREKKVSDLKNRVALINQQSGAVLISIHQNSMPDHPSVHGAQVFYNAVSPGGLERRGECRKRKERQGHRQHHLSYEKCALPRDSHRVRVSVQPGGDPAAFNGRISGEAGGVHRRRASAISHRGSESMKTKTVFYCTECGNETPKWAGRCPACGAWNSIVEQTDKPVKSGRKPASARAVKPVPIMDIGTADEIRFSTGMGELDRVLGGGAVKGSLVLVGGAPGIGKSTLMLQICKKLGEFSKVLYVSGEESAHQLKLRAQRLDVESENLYVLSETCLGNILECVQSEQPDVLIVDSIQTLYNEDLDSPAGGVGQVKDCTMALMQLAKGQGVTVFVIGHVNKEGSIAGPKVLEHMVDCVLYFEGDQHMTYRILRAAKNRFGATNEIGVFEMMDRGLREVENPSEMLLSGRPKDAPGTCVTCAMEGARPVLAEVQALIAPASASNPRRMSNGFDYNRAAMLLAVLEKRGGLKVSACDAYLNIVGGLSLDEPAADLAAVIALASSYLDRPVPSDLVAIGEVGLTGELRSVNQLDQRVSEIQRLGFRRCVVPAHRAGTIKAPTGLTVIPARNIGEAIRAALRPAE